MDTPTKKRPKSALGKKFKKFDDTRPVLFQKLTPNLMKTISGEEELAAVESLEAIFTPIHEIANLQVCSKLKSLDLINTGLMRISNLGAVAATLQRLCLCEQNITKMEGLNLPNLRELFLQHNRLTKIEGLEGCPRLRRLWVHSNALGRLEGLHPLGELEELAAQGNRLRRARGLDALVHLKTLLLAGNRVADLAEVRRLAALPALEELQLADVHFGRNPVVHAPGYREAALVALPRLRALDGVEVAGADRARAADACRAQVERFAAAAAAVERAHLAEVARIEGLRARNSSNARQLAGEMAAALGELEGLVLRGRAEIEQEQRRQERAREENQAELEQRLEDLRARHAAEIDKKIAEEQTKMAYEEKLFLILEKRVEAEKDLALLLSSIQNSGRGGGRR